MSIANYLERLLNNLQGYNEPGSREYLPANEAYELLKYHTGIDFGDDYEKWKQWITEHPRSIHHQDKSKLSTPLLKRLRETYGDRF